MDRNKAESLVRVAARKLVGLERATKLNVRGVLDEIDDLGYADISDVTATDMKILIENYS